MIGRGWEMSVEANAAVLVNASNSLAGRKLISPLVEQWSPSQADVRALKYFSETFLKRQTDILKILAGNLQRNIGWK